MFTVVSRRRVATIPVAPASGRVYPYIPPAAHRPPAGAGDREVVRMRFQQCRTRCGARLHAARQWLAGATDIRILEGSVSTAAAPLLDDDGTGRR
ncbi:hypothetical protein [Actinomadura violacea]|uniref:Uncharacterized protein n=1 Tax=Actinomadura violacea TaxID=2819934 RepID=A0ABS3RXX8_9ACTN|nr:hypothetical protein [Actinomadura violacea]MBO2461608.1 hypothetical protein [Actinomadura violacea]